MSPPDEARGVVVDGVSGAGVAVSMPRRAVLGQYSPFLLPVAWLAVLVWRQDDDPLSTWLLITALVVVVAVATLVGLDVARPPRTELRADVAVLSGPFHRREVPWRDVQAISLGGWTGQTTMHLAGGRRVRSRYPGRALLVSRRRVAADLEIVRRWWVDHRG